MQTFQGTGVCAGVADGPLFFYRPAAVQRTSACGTPAQELEKMHAALETAREQLAALHSEALARGVSEQNAGIFDIQAMMLADLDFVQQIEQKISAQHLCASEAVQCVGEQFAAQLEKLNDPFMRERSADVLDAARRVVLALTGPEEAPLAQVHTRVVLAAHTLLPSQVMQLDRTKICAFVTQAGGPASHAAILVRSLGIPTVMCLCGDYAFLENGVRTMVDGDTGEVVQAPDMATLGVFAQKMLLQVKSERALQALKGLPATTQDGVHLTLSANIALPEETKRALSQDAEGVGLFRSELLYLDSDGFPSEETLFEAYRDVLLSMQHRRVVVRTLDAGEDKHVLFPGLPTEENPALGSRAVPLCFARPELFMTQLRAILRAGTYGELAVVLPMVVGAEEVRAVRALLHRAAEQLQQEGRRTAPVALGVMIETPAAAVLADLLAAEADFVAIGTNDLAQYLLLSDRSNALPMDFHHPALLRTIAQIVHAARQQHKPVCVCGECAADETLAAFFAGLGIQELSMAPAAILKMKRAIRALTKAECEAAVAAALTGAQTREGTA